ncbi:MAG: PLDc N-terminal domain-containing protein, partial [Xanthomonadales bacterium]|nr:PLDc N-terminal domain-containing protein [Xanthomonadales bacterium]
MWLHLLQRHDLAGWIWSIAIFIAHLLVVTRALTRPNRTPASRVAWVAVILSVPALGVIAYLLLGETSIGQARLRRLRRTERLLETPGDDDAAVDVTPRINALFDLCHSINGFRPVAGNRIALLGHADAPADQPMLDSRAAIDALIADIGQARQHVHVAFYIWLDDDAGGRVADAMADAARRGVQCRVMVDALG